MYRTLGNQYTMNLKVLSANANNISSFRGDNIKRPCESFPSPETDQSGEIRAIVRWFTWSSCVCLSFINRSENSAATTNVCDDNNNGHLLHRLHTGYYDKALSENPERKTVGEKETDDE